ncbi:MAG: lysylphosphatidylglycerol synthase transmembrane domain-containing protein [Solirubrobacterales bacterium]
MAGPGEEREDVGGQVAGTPAVGFDTAEDEGINEEPSFFTDPKRLLQTFAIVAVVVVAIYLLVPSIVGLEDALKKLGKANRAWIAVALGFNVLAFGSYVALFRGVVGEHVIRLTWSESYQITMAGLAATRLFSAGGAGGVVLTYWALRKAGMPRRQSATRMLAFLVLLYAVYMLTVVIDGILLRTGVFNGPNPAGLTIVPAAIAGALIGVFLLIALLPADFERRMRTFSHGRRFSRVIRRLATVPASIASGVRTAIDFVRNPSRGGLAIAGAIGFWAANIGILWAAFHAFDVEVPLGVVVQGFFIGMVANLIPFVPGGVGAVDAGLIGTFVLFGYPASEVFAAVLVYRLIAFWLPIPPGIVAFFQLRATVARWDAERRHGPVGNDAAESLPGSDVPGATSITSESKVL